MKKKVIIAIISAISISLILVVYSINKDAEVIQSSETSISEGEGYKDATYSGSGEGFNGKVEVNVTISGEKITDISIGSSKEDAQYLETAKGVIDKIISSQSTDVDTISGATYSSNGIIDGVSEALSKAKK